MLVKEYRILLPLTVEEYRIAQLYMIQKKSRIDSSGEGSGVEIMTNEPYANGLGGSGQYTYKVYHIGNKIPVWIRSVLPSTALEAHEEAWNAYPFTKTRYTCPLMDKFHVDVETRYLDDAGTKENIFELSDDELKNRVIDVIDFVKDSVSNDLPRDEDPRLYCSAKTGRGPLHLNWVQQYVSEGKPVMCAYKICRVEFRYWGLQTRAERWIHDLALRGTMLRAHCQAWAWQDEWVDLTMTDIRKLEEDAARYLSSVMSSSNGDPLTIENKSLSGKQNPIESSRNADSKDVFDENLRKSATDSSDNSEGEGSILPRVNSQSIKEVKVTDCVGGIATDGRRKNNDGSDSDDMFFDCYDQPNVSAIMSYVNGKQGKNKPSLIRWSSELLLGNGDSEDYETPVIFTPKPNPNGSLLILVFHGDVLPENSADTKTTDAKTLSSTLEHIAKNHYPHLKNRVHVLQVSCGMELGAIFKQLKGISSPFNAFHPAFSLLLASHQETFQEAVDAAIKSANQEVHNFLHSDAGVSFQDAEIFVVGDCVGGLLMYEALTSQCGGRQRSETPYCPSPIYNTATGNSQQAPALQHRRVFRNLSSVSMHSDSPQPGADQHVHSQNNHVYSQSATSCVHLKERDPSTSSLFEYNIDEGVPLLMPPPVKTSTVSLGSNPPDGFHQDYSNNASSSTNAKRLQKTQLDKTIRNLSAPPSASFHRPTLNRLSSSSMDEQPPLTALSFKPNTAFLLGCPLAFLLMQRNLTGKHIYALDCEQLYNLYYPLDLCGARLEPVLNAQLAALPELSVPRYHRSRPTGESYSQHAFFDNALETPMLWGSRRVDHQLYCPSEMISLPATALPNILHAAYWESKDVGEFILHQYARSEKSGGGSPAVGGTMSASLMKKLSMDCDIPSRSWNRRRTKFKIANLNANHRANDLIVVADNGSSAIIQARFCYGPMDLVALSFEHVHVYVCTAGGKWTYQSTELTDTHGRVTARIQQALPIGVHSVRMIVQGDHSFLNMYVTVVPPQTECAVFSIDGSLTGSMSVTGRDPRVKPGAVDVVRYWQQQGYIIIYVTARPDMQQRLVTHWLAQHNFPHGMLYFTPSFSTDPLKQKAQLLRQLTEQQRLQIHVAYGSAKDVHVYSSVGVPPDRIFKVSGASKRRFHHTSASASGGGGGGGSASSVSLEDGYAQHLHSLNVGDLPTVGRPSRLLVDSLAASDASNGGGGEMDQIGMLLLDSGGGLLGGSGGGGIGRAVSPSPLTRNNQQSFRNFVHRTESFAPRTGKYASFTAGNKKGSQISISTR